jgi:galactokinase
MVTASAPGRVNLLGEHTDYNDGYVLPTAIAQRTIVALRTNGGNHIALHAAALGRSARFDLSVPPVDHFAQYVYGCLKVLQVSGVRVPGLDIEVDSDVPMGVGLSSSAALEVALLRAMRELLALDLDDIRIAQLAQRAEVDHTGVHCGIMDQMAASLANSRSMLFLDTRSLARRLLPMPADSELLVIDSGLSRSLAASAYNQRRAQCEEAARLLGVRALRDVQHLDWLDMLPPLLQRRARHVVSENARVLRAADGIPPREFGQLMNASHASLRDDYEVSAPPLDRLVGSLQKHGAVYGSRLTGAGFGGACVALCRLGEARRACDDVLMHYRQSGQHGRMLVPGDGTAAQVDA